MDKRGLGNKSIEKIERERMEFLRNKAHWGREEKERVKSKMKVEEIRDSF